MQRVQEQHGNQGSDTRSQIVTEALQSERLTSMLPGGGRGDQCVTGR